MFLKQIHGSDIGKHVILDKRRLGWKTHILDSEGLSKRLIARLIISDLGELKTESGKDAMSALKLSKEGISSFLDAINKTKKDEVVRKTAGTVLGTDVDTALECAAKATESKGLQFWLCFIMNKMDFTLNLVPAKIASFMKDDEWRLKPTTTDLIGYMLADTLQVTLFTKTDEEIEKFNKKVAGSKVANVDLNAVSEVIWRIWVKTVSLVNRIKNELVQNASHWEAFLVKAIDEGETFFPKRLSESQLQQMKDFANIWIDHVFYGLVPTEASPSEEYAWNFHSALVAELSQKDSWLESVLSEDFVQSVVQLEDHVGRYVRGATLAGEYMWRHVKPRVAPYVYESFDVSYLNDTKGTLEREGALGIEVSGIMNEIRTLVDATPLIDKVLPLTEGHVTQNSVVNISAGDDTSKLYQDAMELAIHLGVLIWTEDIDYEPGHSLLFSVDVPEELCKLVSGAVSEEEGPSSIDDEVDAFCICAKQGKGSFEGWFKHPNPYYAGKDEDGKSKGLEDIIWDLSHLSRKASFRDLKIKNFDGESKTVDGSFFDILRKGHVNTVLTKNAIAKEDICREIARLTEFLDVEEEGYAYAKTLVQKLIKLSSKYTHTWVSNKLKYKSGFVKVNFPSTPAGKMYLAEDCIKVFVALVNTIDSEVGSSLYSLIKKVLGMCPVSTLLLTKSDFNLSK